MWNKLVSGAYAQARFRIMCFLRENIERENTMKKSIFALAGRSILAVTLAALLMLSGCRADDSVPTETEPMVFSTGVDVGYDVIMCVDESGPSRPVRSA